MSRFVGGYGVFVDGKALPANTGSLLDALIPGFTRVYLSEASSFNKTS